METPDYGQIMKLYRRARLLVEQGSFDEAIEVYHECHKLCRAADDIASVESILEEMADAHQKNGNLGTSITCLSDALLADDQPQPSERRAELHMQLGLLLQSAEDWPAAAHQLRRAVNVAAECGAESMQATCLAYLAEIRVETGDMHEALELMLRGVSLAHANGDPTLDALIARAQRLGNAAGPSHFETVIQTDVADAELRQRLLN